MKSLFLLSLTLSIGSIVNAQGITDGPYVFHEGDKIISKSIENDVVKIDTIEKEGVLKINVQDHSDWGFTVKLRKSILPEPVIAKQPKKVMFISDIEGEFVAFRTLLLANKVIDTNYNWIFGNGQLVICGDLFDRGKGVMPELWLLYKLETDAKNHGGYIHTILGNHDMMNLSGDYRYVQPKYLTIAKNLGLSYSQLFNEKTELGLWLRSKNIVEKIGENLCLHGGISPEVNAQKLGVEIINEKFKPFYSNYAKAKKNVDKATADFIKACESIFWYRGYFTGTLATNADIENTLKLFKVKRIVVGHTITDHNISFYYQGRVLGVDVNQHANSHQVALYDHGKWSKFNEKGERFEILTNSSEKSKID